jgi:L-threonylcarbamoyladenylate synthase
VAEILRVDAIDPDPALINRAAMCIRSGGLVAFPTETVYGLGADAINRDAVRRIFTAKGRPVTDPLIVHVQSLDAAMPLVRFVPDIAVTLAEQFWPGPLTIVFGRSAAIGDDVTGGLDTVAIRVPAHHVALALVTAAGVPIAAPSANLFSRPSPTRAEHVASDLGDRIDMILDAGPTQVGVESTVLNLTSDPPLILRPGGVSVEQLRKFIPDLAVHDSSSSSAQSMASPGMLTKHYAPRKPLVLLEGERRAIIEHAIRELITADEPAVLLGSRDMVAAVRERLHDGAAVDFLELGPESEPEAMASRLYAALRECDEVQGHDVIAMQPGGITGIVLALRDRLRRAAAGNIIICH